MFSCYVPLSPFHSTFWNHIFPDRRFKITQFMTWEKKKESWLCTWWCQAASTKCVPYSWSISYRSINASHCCWLFKGESAELQGSHTPKDLASLSAHISLFVIPCGTGCFSCDFFSETPEWHWLPPLICSTVFNMCNDCFLTRPSSSTWQTHHKMRERVTSLAYHW